MVEEVRKGMQDSLAPELRGLAGRLDVVEKQLAELKAEMQNGFREAERRAEKRQDELLAQMRQVLDYALLEQRMSRIEQEQKRLGQ